MKGGFYIPLFLQVWLAILLHSVTGQDAPRALVSGEQEISLRKGNNLELSLGEYFYLPEDKEAIIYTVSGVDKDSSANRISSFKNPSVHFKTNDSLLQSLGGVFGFGNNHVVLMDADFRKIQSLMIPDLGTDGQTQVTNLTLLPEGVEGTCHDVWLDDIVKVVYTLCVIKSTPTESEVKVFYHRDLWQVQSESLGVYANSALKEFPKLHGLTIPSGQNTRGFILVDYLKRDTAVQEPDAEYLRVCVRSLSSDISSFSIDCKPQNAKKFTAETKSTLVTPRDISVVHSNLVVVGFLPNSANLAIQICSITAEGASDFAFNCAAASQKFTNSNILAQYGAGDKLLVVDPASKIVYYCLFDATKDSEIQKLLMSPDCKQYSVSNLDLEKGLNKIRSLQVSERGWSLVLKLTNAADQSINRPGLLTFDLVTGTQSLDTVNWEVALQSGHYFLKYKYDHTSVYIRRPGRPTWTLDQNACENKASTCKIGLTASGDKGTVQVNFALTILDDKPTAPKIISNRATADHDLLYFSNQQLNFQASDFQGDNVVFTGSAQGDIEKTIAVSVYHSNKLKLELKQANSQAGIKLSDVYATEDDLVALTSQQSNEVAVFECLNTELDSRVCTVKYQAVVPMPGGEVLSDIQWAAKLTPYTVGLVVKTKTPSYYLIHLRLDGSGFVSKWTKINTQEVVQATGGVFINPSTKAQKVMFFVATQSSLLVYEIDNSNTPNLVSTITRSLIPAVEGSFKPVSVSLVTDPWNVNNTLLALTHKLQERTLSKAKTFISLYSYLTKIAPVSQVEVLTPGMDVLRTCVLEKNPASQTQTPKLVLLAQRTSDSAYSVVITSPWDASLRSEELYSGQATKVVLNCGASSQADLFSLLVSKDSSNTAINYYRDAASRASKAVHSEIANVPSNLKSFPLRNNLAFHLAVGAQGDVQSWMSFPEGPLLYADVNGEPSKFAYAQSGTDRPLSGQIALSAANSVNTSNYTGPVVVNFQNYGLRFIKRSSAPVVKSITTKSSYDLEEFIQVPSATERFFLQNNTQSEITLQPRISLLSEYRPRPAPAKAFLYSHVQFSERLLFAAGFYADSTSSLMIIHVYEEEGVEETIEIPVVGHPLLFKSIVLNVASRRYIFFGLFPTDLTLRIYHLRYIVVEDGAIISQACVTPSFITKLELIPTLKQTTGEHSFHLIRSDGQSTYIETLKVVPGASSPVTLLPVRTMQNMSTFGVALNSDKWLVVGYGNQAAGFDVLSFNPSNFKDLLDSKSIIPNRNYVKVSIDCKGYSGARAVCAVNTRSSYIVEMYIKSADLGVNWYYHLKYLNYQVTKLRIDDDYLVATGISSTPGVRNRSVLVWKSAENVGTSRLFALQKVTDTKEFALPLEHELAFDLARFDKTDTKGCLVAIATANTSAPLRRYRAGNMKLVIGGKVSTLISIDGIQLVAKGLFEKSMPLSQVLTDYTEPGPEPDTPFHTGFWWVMVVGLSFIAIIVLIFVAVLYCRKAPPMGLNDSVIYMDAELDDSNTFDHANILGNINAQDKKQPLTK